MVLHIKNPMFCQVFFPFNPLFRPEAHLETFVSRKILGLDKKNFYPIFVFFLP